MKIPALITLALSSVSASAALSITFEYDFTGANYGSMKNAEWDGSTSNTTKENAFKAVMEAAADRWEKAYMSASNITRNITIDVSWQAEGGSTLATGGASWTVPSGNFTTNYLRFDNDGSSSFFVDLTPNDASEWSKSSRRSQSFGGVSMISENVYYQGVDSIVQQNTDMLSVATHEIGHALGLLGSYPGYSALNNGDSTLKLSNGAYVPFNGGHTSFTIGTPEYTEPDPFLFPRDGTSIGATYGPNVMSPSIVGGIRKDITEVDLQILGDTLGFEEIDFSHVPEPTSMTLLGIGSFALILRRRRHAHC